MSEGIAVVAAAPEVITVGSGKESRTLRMAPLRLREMGMFERFVHARLGETARGMAGGDMFVLAELMQRISRIGFWHAESVSTMLYTRDGQCYIVWLGCLIEQPELTLDWMTTNIREDQLSAAIEAMTRLNFPESNESKKATGAAASTT